MEKELIHNDWIEYPLNKPIDTDITWYFVLLRDGSITQACWWLGHWYCFLSDVVAFGSKAPQPLISLRK